MSLYCHYQQQRHGEICTQTNSEQEYREFILASNVNSFLAEFRNKDGALKIVALVDRLPQALSAVYTFYAQEPGTSYGTHAILWQIAQARHWQLPHVHLGYWIADSAKMRYKAHFQPCELLHGRQWQAFASFLQ